MPVYNTVQGPIIVNCTKITRHKLLAETCIAYHTVTSTIIVILKIIMGIYIIIYIYNIYVYIYIYTIIDFMHIRILL